MSASRYVVLEPDSPAAAPRVFVSYSHDSDAHKAWVLNLAARLVANGVDIMLDQWDLRLGSDLPRFMEQGLTASKRVLAVCSSAYVTRANDGRGGVGYEKMILTAQLMRDVTSERIIPVLRDNTIVPALPHFLGSRVYADFRDDGRFENAYADLVREIHGVHVLPRPPLGRNPFASPPPTPSSPTLQTQSERYVSAPLSGGVTFDYSNNDGAFVIGVGDMAFETRWSSASSTSIHAYRNGPSMRTVALASGVQNISNIEDASVFDGSSRVRTPSLGEILVWQNSAGYWAATKIEAISVRSGAETPDSLTFSYMIQSTRSPSFTFT